MVVLHGAGIDRVVSPGSPMHFHLFGCRSGVKHVGTKMRISKDRRKSQSWAFLLGPSNLGYGIVACVHTLTTATGLSVVIVLVSHPPS